MKLLLIALAIVFSTLGLSVAYAASGNLSGEAKSESNSFNLGGGGQAQRPDGAGSWYHDGLHAGDNN